MSQSDNDELNNYLDNVWGTNQTQAETKNSHETLSSSENASQSSFSHQTDLNTTCESTSHQNNCNSGYFANSQASEASQDPDTTTKHRRFLMTLKQSIRGHTTASLKRVSASLQVSRAQAPQTAGRL